MGGDGREKAQGELSLDPEIGTADDADDADGQAFIANGTLTNQVRGEERRLHPQILSSVPSAQSAVIFISVSRPRRPPAPLLDQSSMLM